MIETSSIIDSGRDGAENRSGVLARKYRPEDFDGVIGQEPVVRMLRHALHQNRVAQALVFSGVRGTGKTTLARIVAKGLNCLDSDKPTDQPCGKCQSCQEIAQSNSLDVQEIDAASHTGVDHIRDLIGSVSYRATGRFKVYILDEVHMLSTSAFNALLKTLEEPPRHVRFIFATTEIRKIPPTVLSRTQRFHLRRVQNDDLSAFLATVVKKEQASAEPAALDLIARAAQGSVRDGLSLLDQFLSGSKERLGEAFVREQLGLSGAHAVQEIFAALLEGEGEKMLALLDAERAAGSDSLNLIRDLLGLCHQLSRHKVLENTRDADFSEAEQALHERFSRHLSMPHLARLWQVLLKGAEEVRLAPDQAMAFEMLMIRAHFLADVPTPQQILDKHPPRVQGEKAPHEATATADMPREPEDVIAPPELEMPAEEGTQELAMTASSFNDFTGLIDALSDHRELHLAEILRQDARLQEFGEEAISLFVPEGERQRVQGLADVLRGMTGKTWRVTILETPEGTQDTLHEQQEARRQQRLKQVENDPTLQTLQHLFPGAKPKSILSE